MKSIKFKNYKVFEFGEIELRPITILLGANSSGKSSILHLLLMLEQTISNKGDYKSAFKTNGHCVTMGEDINLLKDFNRQSILSLEFSLEKENYISKLRSYQSQLLQDLILGYLLNLKKYSPKKLKEFEDVTKDLINNAFEQKYHDSAPQVKDYLMTNAPNDNGILSILLEKQNVLEKMNSGWWEDYSFENGISVLMSRLISCFHKFDEFSKEEIKDVSISYSFSFNSRIRKLIVRECQIKIDSRVFMSISFFRNKPILSSDIFLKDDLAKLANLTSPSFFFNGLSIRMTKESNNPFDMYIYNIFDFAYDSIKSFYSSENLNYIGPLRANPQRYYFLDDSNENPSFDFFSGERIAELLKSNRNLSARINKWMENFGLSIKVSEFKDVIHKIKVKQNSLNLDLPDVGFGVSQILPILVDGVLSGNSTTTIMEQPEIHLHPKMQAELADFFIEVVSNANHSHNQYSKKHDSHTKRRYLIETHSEYILKRIRRRIAEGKLSSDDVAIYFIEPRSKKNQIEARIKRTSIESDGTIEWPSDYYMTEYEDELAFFKLKIAKSEIVKKDE